MGQENPVPRRINKIEGILGQIIQSQGPGSCEAWVNPSDIGVDYGLAFIGTVTGIVAAPKFQCSGLAGFGDEFFKDYWAYVVWDSAGGGAAPQGQMLQCTGYSSATGDFTVTAFAPVITVGDKVLLLHPSIAATLPGRMLFSMDFWSVPQEEVPVGDGVAGATEALPTVTVADLPAGATIVRAIAMLKFRMIENTNVAANKLNGATVATTSQVIQVDDAGATGFVDGINFVDDMFGLAASTRESGDVQIGSIDIAARVDGNDVYSFRWLLARADLDFLNFNDVQTGLRIWYTV